MVKAVLSEPRFSTWPAGHITYVHANEAILNCATSNGQCSTAWRGGAEAEALKRSEAATLDWAKNSDQLRAICHVLRTCSVDGGPPLKYY